MPMSEYMRRIREKLGPMRLEIPTVSVLAFDERDRVVLVRHAETGGWTTPGGAVEPDEVPADAAVREMWEETGLFVELLRVLGIYGGPAFSTTYSNGDQISFAMTVFEGRLRAGSLRPDGEETLEAAWFEPGQLAALPAAPWVRAVVERAWARREPPWFEPPRWRPPEAAPGPDEEP